MTKYVNYGSPRYGIHMFVITMFKTEQGNYKIEVLPCDTCGNPVSDPVAWDIFTTRWNALKYIRKQYKEFYRYVNSR